MSSFVYLGPIGVAARVLGGLAAIAVPVLASGLTWWDLAAAAVLPLVAMVVVTLVDAAAHDGSLRGRPILQVWIRSLVTVAFVLGLATAMTFVTAVDGTAIWVFIGISLLVAAYRRDAACEVVAIPNAITGRRDPGGCIVYGALDAVEEMTAGRSGAYQVRCEGG